MYIFAISLVAVKIFRRAEALICIVTLVVAAVSRRCPSVPAWPSRRRLICDPFPGAGNQSQGGRSGGRWTTNIRTRFR